MRHLSQLHEMKIECSSYVNSFAISPRTVFVFTCTDAPAAPELLPQCTLPFEVRVKGVIGELLDIFERLGANIVDSFSSFTTQKPSIDTIYQTVGDNKDNMGRLRANFSISVEQPYK